jgi:hypothetical protein
LVHLTDRRGKGGDNEIMKENWSFGNGVAQYV